MIRLALTGSIGMGKSTTARLFAEEGVPVWDADAAVHKLYGAGMPGAEAVRALVPDAVGADGVDRAVLREAIAADNGLLSRIEAAVHPLVAADREAFLARAEDAEAPVALCDIPLLFEIGEDAAFDRVVVVTAPEDVQRARVLEREGMTEAAFEAILARQVPDAEKRRRAHHVIDTSRGVEEARADVRKLLETLEGGSHA